MTLLLGLAAAIFKVGLRLRADQRKRCFKMRQGNVLVEDRSLALRELWSRLASASLEVSRRVSPVCVGFSKAEPYAELGRKWNSHCGSWTKEIAQRACRDPQLVQAGDRLRLAATGIQAKSGRII
jgi:hypothetical protein